MCERYNWRSNKARVVRSTPALKARPRSAYLARVPDVRASVAFRSKSSGVGPGAVLARVRGIDREVSSTCTHVQISAIGLAAQRRETRKPARRALGPKKTPAGSARFCCSVALAPGSRQKPRDRNALVRLAPALAHFSGARPWLWASGVR